MSGLLPKWLMYFDLTDIFKELPRLQEMDKERQKREVLQQKEENENKGKETWKICLFVCCERFWTKWVSHLV